MAQSVIEREHISTTSSDEVNVMEDRFSFLPAETRCHIMSFLPTHEAFKTTLMSREWKTMWPSFPILIFHYLTFPDVDEKLDCFLQFIRHTIAHHDDSSLKTFQLSLSPPDMCDARIESAWVEFAVQHNVQNISLCGKLEIGQEMPECLFTCSSIVNMELSITSILLKWPEAAVLPNLRRLVLADMALSENLLFGLSSGCPQLETLRVLTCHLWAIKVFPVKSPRLKVLDIFGCIGIENCKVELVTPSLEKFSYISDVALDYDITHLDSLSVVEVMFWETSPVPRRDNRYLSAIKLAGGICSARRLMLDELFIKFLFNYVHPSGKLEFILFRNLEMVSLSLWPTREQVLTTFLLLSRCPKLSVVNIYIITPKEPTVNDQSSNIQFPNTLGKLTSVQITEFKESENEMQLVKIFLLNCPSLRELKIGLASEDYEFESDPDFLQIQRTIRTIFINRLKSKIFQMQDLARSPYVNISFS